MVIINKKAGPVDHKFTEQGRNILAPGESICIGMKDRQAAVAVEIEGSVTASYSVEISQATLDLVESDNGKFRPSDTEDKTSSDDFYIAKGTAIYIINRASSTDNITVDWGV